MKRYFYVLVLILIYVVCVNVLHTEIYVPPGYGNGANLQGNNFGIDFGYSKIENDIYITLNPFFELPFLGFRLGLQVPLEVLVYDPEPKQTVKTPALRPGTFDSIDDYSKVIKYISYGTHLYFDPDDSFNWSMFYGQMRDGFIGHKTIIHRYNSSYDPSVWNPGLMFDINNNWGGVEYFTNNVFRKEIRGYRIYIRPVGIFNSIYNISYNDSNFDSKSVVLSIKENQNPSINRDFLFEVVPPEEDTENSNQRRLIQPGKGGSLKQHLLKPLREDLKESQIEVQEVVDPSTGEVKLVPYEKQEIPGNSPTQLNKTDTIDTKERMDSGFEETEKTIKKHGFWNRWAIGVTNVIDYGVPLELEYDGSGNLVIDPETKLPRASKSENLTITGMDMELRLSPLKWMDVTPYIDINRVKNFSKSKGTHIGINFEMKISNLFKWYLRPEYREITSNYIPEYFDSLYAIQRINYQTNLNEGTNTATTKYAYLKSLPDDGNVSKGYFINSMLEFVNIFVLEISYQDYEGPNNSRIFAGFYVPNIIMGFFLNGYYIKSNFNGIKEAFQTKSENAMLAAEAGIQLFGGLYFKYTLKRTWTYNNETGQYAPVDEKIIGFGFSSTN